MKRIALMACSLLLVGCAGPSNEGSSETPDQSSAAASTRAALEVSDAATCQTLIGTDGGLVSETGQFLIDVKDLSDTTAADASSLADALQGVGETSSERFRSLLTVMQEPFRDLVTAHENGDEFSLDASRFKAAGNEVIALCEPLMEAGAAEKTPQQAQAAPSSTASRSTTARTADPNDQACIRFAESHNRLASYFDSGKGSLSVEAWREAQADEVAILDAQSLAAEGDIAERMEAAVSIIPPTPLDMVGPYEWRIGEEYNQLVDRVYTACAADGTAYEMKELTLPPEILRR
jgi:hypothetical protein